MSANDPTLKTRPIEREVLCVVCMNRQTIKSCVLGPGVVGFVVAMCATCPGNPVMHVVEATQ